MGYDKALLAIEGIPLIRRIAAEVRKAAGSVTVIGPRQRYDALGLPCVEDLVPGRGPMGGLFTALSISRAEWNLVIACDMPRVNAAVLRTLFEAAEGCGHRAVIPARGSLLEPLCAVYHRDLLPEVASALEGNRLRMHDFAAKVDAFLWPVSDAGVFQNVNTPGDWAEAASEPR
jgi:molybdopterin-guanine dinucleotide biosynthesis protein A